VLFRCSHHPPTSLLSPLPLATAQMDVTSDAMTPPQGYGFCRPSPEPSQELARPNATCEVLHHKLLHQLILPLILLHIVSAATRWTSILIFQQQLATIKQEGYNRALMVPPCIRQPILPLAQVDRQWDPGTALPAARRGSRDGIASSRVSRSQQDRRLPRDVLAGGLDGDPRTGSQGLARDRKLRRVQISNRRSASEFMQLPHHVRARDGEE